MTELLTAAQMRAIEQAAIASGTATGRDLMERAGRGVVEAVFEHWPDLAAAPFRAAVLCGPGNNGGDGFVVARLLREWGWEAVAYLYGDPDKLPPDARANHDRWCGMGGRISPIRAFDDVPRDRPDLVVDALFGTGLSRGLDEIASHALGVMEIMRSWDRPARVVAVDMPSGYCADSGRRLFETSEVVARYRQRRPGADLTVTFERLRLGHRLDRAALASGKVAVKPLGIRHESDGPLCNSATPIATECRIDARWLGKRTGAHKYSHGHALILSGGTGRTGAARLAARGALRIGAGLVTLAVPPAAQSEVAGQVTAIMLRRVADGDGLAALLGDTRLNALCLGPGLGLGDRARDLVAAALDCRRAIVLDADALTLAGGDTALFSALHENCVLTPHGGEFARLFPDLADRLEASPTRGPAYSKVDATRAAAGRAGCTVLFKGPDTVIAEPGGRCVVNPAHGERAAPWLATAGSGDVLAGFVTGLLARGLTPMQAAESAAWLHVECARSFGPGLIAEDLPEQLPAVFRALDL
ncbi:MAG: NAD(P)H-hydrate dehydratase [Jhaorihella sp.]